LKTEGKRFCIPINKREERYSSADHRLRKKKRISTICIYEKKKKMRTSAATKKGRGPPSALKSIVKTKFDPPRSGRRGKGGRPRLKKIFETTNYSKAEKRCRPPKENNPASRRFEREKERCAAYLSAAA